MKDVVADSPADSGSVTVLIVEDSVVEPAGGSVGESVVDSNAVSVADPVVEADSWDASVEEGTGSESDSAVVADCSS